MSASKPPFLEPEIRESLRHVSVRGGRVELRAFPDFLIIGPQRTGTTWLYENLRSHPQLFLPKGKESYYFSTLGRPEHPKFRYSELEDYLGAMDDGCRDRLRKTAHCLLNFGQLYRPEVRGEATATYAKLPGEVIAEICRINPEIKAVIMLRDPLERAWSHAKKDLVDSSGGPASQIPAAHYEKFFRAEGQRQLACYVALIENWLEHLRPGNLFLGDFRLLHGDPARLVGAILRFLGVRSEEKYFTASLGRRINATGKNTIPPATDAYLRHLLEAEMIDFEALLEALESGAYDGRAVHAGSYG